MKKYYKNEYSKKIAVKDFNLCGKHFKKNSIIITDKYHSSYGTVIDVYVCERFPRTYTGNNPILCIWSYNEHYDEWTLDRMQNKISRMMWRVFCETGRRVPSTDKLYLSDQEALNMMQTKTMEKKSGARLGCPLESELRYKQITPYAYYANLESAKSGNASVVASCIYN